MKKLAINTSRCPRLEIHPADANPANTDVMLLGKQSTKRLEIVKLRVFFEHEVESQSELGQDEFHTAACRGDLWLNKWKKRG